MPKQAQPDRPVIRSAPQFQPVAAQQPESLLAPPVMPSQATPAPAAPRPADPEPDPVDAEPGDAAGTMRRRQRDPEKRTMYLDRGLLLILEDVTLRWQRKYLRRHGKVDKGLVQDAMLAVALRHLDEVEKELVAMM